MDSRLMTDAAARHAALTQLEKSLLVEAGAGSGKTSLLAGRIVSLLASGVHPRNIAAVSFTEMAAAELLARVTEFSEKVMRGDPPIDLAQVFSSEPVPEVQVNLKHAIEHLGELTCTTIHGFCQRLLKPYPVEADIDPGAQILDPVEASLMFDDVFNEWIRKRLDTADDHLDILTELVSVDPARGISAIKELASVLRLSPDLEITDHAYDHGLCEEFSAAVKAFRDWCDALPTCPPEHDAVIEALSRMADRVCKCDPVKPHSAVAEIACLDLAAIRKADGGFRQYRMKTKWQACASTKKDGERLNDEAVAHYERCTEALGRLRSMAAGAGLSMLGEEIRPMLDMYHERKRASAALDFEDLLVSTRRLLKEHPDVTKALSARYTRILVDEFQDTDPVQADIFRMLAFDRKDDCTWTPREGSIFLVGDPKQAIYRFRGADVKTYLEMRGTMEANDPSSILQVSTNFRSTKGILDYVNGVFEEPLSHPHQPGFTALSPHRQNVGEFPAVATFNVGDLGSVSLARDEEARQVAELCVRLLESYRVPDGDGTRPCTAADIALLAPTGSELWRYEHALEEAGISVATQAGKGMFQRQEVHDLIALTRVLADHRDTLALGALLRGPLVGLTEGELLDAAEALPAEEEDRLQFIRVGLPPEQFSHPVLREVMEKLHLLRKVSLETTPHELLSYAVDMLNVRATLRARHKTPDRAIANVDRYLEMSRPYSVRGLRAFSDAMRKTWEDNERMAEGRPDGETQSISLITMHSAKGLEWPVVIAVNTMTALQRQRKIVVDVTDRKVTMPFLDILPPDYADAKVAAESEDFNERVRLWYVAATRARDLLVIPVHEKHDGNEKHWCGIVDLKLEDIGPLDLAESDRNFVTSVHSVGNGQDKETFAAEAKRIERQKKPVIRISPSRHETSPLTSDRLSIDELIEAEPVIDPAEMKTGGPERGVVMHKLIEEVLTGETEEDEASLKERAAELCLQFAASKNSQLSKPLDPDAMASEVARTLALPEIEAIRERLFPEVATAASIDEGELEKAVIGVMDAAEVMEDGRVRTVVDWKSDPRPTPSTIDHYKKQVRQYMEMNNAERGLIVFMTAGKVVEVTRGIQN